MASPNAFLGRHRDIPLGPSLLIPAASAGSASDYEHIVHIVTQLAQGASSDTVSDLPLNEVNVRNVLLCFEAGITGAATNNFTLDLWQKRAGALLVNTTPPVSTTASTSVGSAGSATITPASMANIAVGTQLYISGGTGTAETVTVSAVTGTTFTATFANTHSGTYNITSVSTITAAGLQSYTPASMANIVVGTLLVISGGTGTAETVTVSAVTTTSFTATFANAHSVNFTIQSAPLASVTYASGTNETALVPHQLAIPILTANALQPGDIVTLARVSSNSTGLASPAFTVELDLVPAGIGH